MKRSPISVALLFGTLFGAAITGQAQAVVDGVSLAGDANAPVIVNHSTHRILEYTLLFHAATGSSRPSTYSMLGQLRKAPLSSVGIAPGASWVHAPNISTQILDASVRAPASATSVALDSVLFEDGSFAGPDKAGQYDMLIARLQAEKD